MHSSKDCSKARRSRLANAHISELAHVESLGIIVFQWAYCEWLSHVIWDARFHSFLALKFAHGHLDGSISFCDLCGGNRKAHEVTPYHVRHCEGPIYCLKATLSN